MGRGNTPEKGGEVDVEMGGWHFFITLQFICIYCVCMCVGGGGGGKFPLLHFGSSFF